MAGAIAHPISPCSGRTSCPRPVLLLLVMGLAAVVGGGLWGLLPAFFKARWGTNETLFTLMLNYIIVGVEKYFQNGPWKAPTSSFPKIAMFARRAAAAQGAGRSPAGSSCWR